MICNIQEVNGDIFSADGRYSMAHCVAADMKMGKGIAAQFRNRFGNLSHLHKQNVKPGGVAVLKHNSRFIYYLVTKNSSWDKPTYQTLHSSLESMRKHMVEHNITKLCMPKIGCGLDGLMWTKVKDLIQEVFCNDDISITVYYFIPPKQQ